MPMPPLKPAGIFFYEGDRKWIARGVTYGPFRPNEEGMPFPGGERLDQDMRAIARLGANAVRVYTPPSPSVIEATHRHGLRLLADVPWPKHIDVYDHPKNRKLAFEALDEALENVRDCPNLMGLLLGNEIPPDLVRWAGPRKVERFLEKLYDHAKSAVPDVPIGFANYPSTEYLVPAFFDFLGFNVYLSDPINLRAYLARLRNLLPDVPLVLTETGEDSIRQGEEAQSRTVCSAVAEAYDTGFAGAFVFSWTDEWHAGGYDIEDWAFGVVDAERQPRAMHMELSRVFDDAPRAKSLPAEPPRVSVVVASYNGGKTLRNCLRSLEKLNYPDYEVIVVDDGSTDDTSSILGDFPDVRVVAQENRGLSCARNEGIRAARGGIVAFTDSDCYADADWLHHLVVSLEGEQCAGVGGPNLSPWEENPVHRSVALAPGHATHVLLEAEHAEHVPGCNMAFRRDVLLQFNGFDPLFRKAGDDVDMIWRLQDMGYHIRYAPGAFVWHHRRSSVRDYWRQQAGYGEAEALLIRKHPHRFNDRGQSLWRGTIYTGPDSASPFVGPNIHYGIFASSGYQCIYTRPEGYLVHFVTSLEWWLFCLLLLVAGLLSNIALAAGVAGMTVSLFVSGIKARRRFARRHQLPRWCFFVVWFLWISQPIVRTGSRILSHMRSRRPSKRFAELLDGIERRRRRKLIGRQVSEYWTEKGTDRITLLRNVLDRMKQEEWLFAPNTGWEAHDLSVGVTWTHRVFITTVAEDHGDGKLLLRMRFDLRSTSLLRFVVVAILFGCGLLAFYDTVVARLVFLGFVLAGWYFYRLALVRRAAIQVWMDETLSQSGYIPVGDRKGTAEFPSGDGSTGEDAPSGNRQEARQERVAP